jgi:hypothetical protein
MPELGPAAARRRVPPVPAARAWSEQAGKQSAPGGAIAAAETVLS